MLAFCSTRAPDEVMGMTEALRHVAPSCGEHLGGMPYAAWQKAFDPLLTPGARNYWKSHNFNTLNDGAIDAIIEYAGKLPTEQSEIFLGLLGGQANRMPVEATAYPHRNVMYAMNVHTRWTDPAQDTACIAWAREFFSAATPYAAGSVYINFLTEEEGVRIADAYGPNYQRLAELKAKYDPANLFRRNQNIRPSP